MATAITFPAQFPAQFPAPDSTSLLHGVGTPFPIRRHRLESDADRADRRNTIHRHPSSQSAGGPTVPASSVSISCSDCQYQRTAACDDCIVTFICGSVVHLGPEDALVLRSLQEAGLLPMSQHATVSVFVSA